MQASIDIETPVKYKIEGISPCFYLFLNLFKDLKRRNFSSLSKKNNLREKRWHHCHQINYPYSFLL